MLKHPLPLIVDDTEEAPWMVMGTPQSDATDLFYSALRSELRRHASPLFAAMLLPIRYEPIPGEAVVTLSPDVLVAPVARHPRQSYTVADEGASPSFVLEIISPESRTRDLRTKPAHYERMGVQEYALFAPETAEGMHLLHPPLQGYRVDPTQGGFAAWETDDEGRLYSAVLGLWLVVRDGELRLQRQDGSMVPILDEETQAREAAERAWAAEAHARQAAEAELVRLRGMLAGRDEP